MCSHGIIGIFIAVFWTQHLGIANPALFASSAVWCLISNVLMASLLDISPVCRGPVMIVMSRYWGIIEALVQYLPGDSDIVTRALSTQDTRAVISGSHGGTNITSITHVTHITNTLSQCVTPPHSVTHVLRDNPHVSSHPSVMMMPASVSLTLMIVMQTLVTLWPWAIVRVS